jgi:hypothetical protein
MQTLEEIIARWDSGEGRPYKGKLIDWSAYNGDGEEPPTDIGCMCAGGQILHLLGGWSPGKLHAVAQRDADLETAKLLNISAAHAILLRQVNDSVSGAPSIVLTNPEKILGDQAHIILAFWRHIDRMTGDDWGKMAAARTAARTVARDVAWAASWDAAGDAARDAARAAAWAASWDAAWDVAGDAAWDVAGDAARDAVWASNEIQGAKLMRSRMQKFFFLPLFGFASPEEIPLS